MLYIMVDPYDGHQQVPRLKSQEGPDSWLKGKKLIVRISGVSIKRRISIETYRDKTS